MKRLKKYLLSAVGVSLAISFIILGTMIAIIAAQGKVVTEEGQIESTGILRLSSNVSNYSATVNGNPVSVNNNLVEYLKPGPVSIKISKAKYQDWQKEILVKENEVIDLYPNLILASLIPVQLNEETLGAAAFSSNGEYLFYTVTESILKSQDGLYRLKLSKGLIDFGESTPKQISEFSTEFLESLNGNEYFLNVAPEGDKVLINIPKLKEVYYYEAGNPRKGVNLITDIGFYPEKIEWFDDSSSLLIEQNGNLFEYQISSKLMSVVFLSQQAKTVYTVGKDKVYYVKPSKEELMLYKNKKSEVLELPKNFIFPASIVSLTTSVNADNILVINSASGVIYLNTSEKLFEIVDKFSAGIVKVSQNGMGFIYLKEETLGAYYIDNRKNQNDGALNGVSINTSINYIDKVSAVFDRSLARFLWLSPESSVVKFEISDIEGTNRKEIYSKENSEVIDFTLTPDNNDLHIILREGANLEQINAYKLTLR